ncbi:PilZ domain-containing protein [Fulvimarina manganoxydans]|uniref:PilZ domain-containing protein n=1 Tax=Fulvimarina manganoxydans TaxID=937218 RepID=A0A1W2EQU6_9HYPH|nr:PilZ domain-containing protein [Fulvimarina manganoxydans]MEE2950110.1 PilZ domain-containing protein [Pseudomonadota bacterium]SMD11892.1 PilZ domain-containing protein [Fulvimarina manganoxydans]
MLERRNASRRRVCLHGVASAGLSGTPVPIRVRSISDGGAEVVADRGCLPDKTIGLSIGREDGRFRLAEVCWRRGNRFGVKFGETDRPSNDTLPGWLSELLSA